MVICTTAQLLEFLNSDIDSIYVNVCYLNRPLNTLSHCLHMKMPVNRQFGLRCLPNPFRSPSIDYGGKQHLFVSVSCHNGFLKWVLGALLCINHTSQQYRWRNWGTLTITFFVLYRASGHNHHLVVIKSIEPRIIASLPHMFQMSEHHPNSK